MTLYRTKQVIVDARYFNGSNGRDISAWMADYGDTSARTSLSYLSISEVDGRTRVLKDHWVVRSGNEFRVLSDERFRERYEEVR